MNEMMERIKHGVVLRPVKSQDSKVRMTQADGGWRGKNASDLPWKCCISNTKIGFTIDLNN